MPRSAEEPESSETRTLIARAFTLVEDVVYIGIGALLALSAAMLLVNGALGLWRATMDGAPDRFRNGMLEIALLTLMTVALVASLLMLRRVRDPAKVSAPRS